MPNGERAPELEPEQEGGRVMPEISKATLESLGGVVLSRTREEGERILERVSEENPLFWEAVINAVEEKFPEEQRGAVLGVAFFVYLAIEKQLMAEKAERETGL